MPLKQLELKARWERSKRQMKDEQLGRHRHTEEPYFGGHPFHFTRYSTLPWEEREADTVSYTAAPATTHRTVRPNTFCRLMFPQDIHSPGTLQPLLTLHQIPTNPEKPKLWLLHDYPRLSFL